MSTKFENMDRNIPFNDTPRKQLTCKKCGKTYYPPVSLNVNSISCPYCKDKEQGK